MKFFVLYWNRFQGQVDGNCLSTAALWCCEQQVKLAMIWVLLLILLKVKVLSHAGAWKVGSA